MLRERLPQLGLLLLPVQLSASACKPPFAPWPAPAEGRERGRERESDTHTHTHTHTHTQRERTTARETDRDREREKAERQWTHMSGTVAPGTPPLGTHRGLTREAPGGDGLPRREVPQVGA